MGTEKRRIAGESRKKSRAAVQVGKTVVKNMPSG